MNKKLSINLQNPKKEHCICQEGRRKAKTDQRQRARNLKKEKQENKFNTLKNLIYNLVNLITWTQIYNIKNENRKITADKQKVERITEKYFVKLYENTLENLDELDYILGKQMKKLNKRDRNQKKLTVME